MKLGCISKGAYWLTVKVSNMHGGGGGLCVLWSDSVDLELISFSNNHISLKVDESNGARIWLFSGVYGWPEKNKQEKTLSLMRNIKPNGGSRGCALEISIQLCGLRKKRGQS